MTLLLLRSNVTVQSEVEKYYLLFYKLESGCKHIHFARSYAGDYIQVKMCNKKDF
jgi:hypothetical protein